MLFLIPFPFSGRVTDVTRKAHGVTQDRFTYGYSVIPREILSGRDIVATVQTEMGKIPQAPGPAIAARRDM